MRLKYHLTKIALFPLAGNLLLSWSLHALEQTNVGEKNYTEPNYLNKNNSSSFPQHNASLRDLEKENLSPQQPSQSSYKKATMEDNRIPQDVQTILIQIKEGYHEGDASKIQAAYRDFSLLDINWKTVGRALKVTKWPSQPTWKDAVGGHLFFPINILDWKEDETNKFRLERRDTLQALAVSAKFKHPCAWYFLATALDIIHSKHTDAPKPAFFSDLYKQSLETLEQCKEIPMACYVMGQSYVSSTTLLVDRFDAEKAIEWYSQAKDQRNLYAVLKIRQNFMLRDQAPSAEEFLNLARSGYYLSYFAAARMENNLENRLAILNEAVKQNYDPAWMYLGILYEKQFRTLSWASDLLEKARTHYEEAGRKGVSSSYIALGQSYVGDIISQDSVSTRKKFNDLPSALIEKAAWAFKKAGEAHHPQGWDYLAQLYWYQAESAEECCPQENSSIHKEIEKYYENMYDALVKGIKLGSQRAYSQVYFLYSKNILRSLIQKYGPAPQDKSFRESIESFLST